MTPREARVPEVRAGELAQYEASGRLRPFLPRAPTDRSAACSISASESIRKK